jgi:hypothetical protein
MTEGTALFGHRRPCGRRCLLFDRVLSCRAFIVCGCVSRGLRIGVKQAGGGRRLELYADVVSTPFR